jgi:AraC-like DNA-binding protein
MGRQMGRYIAAQLGGHGTVMEVMGLKGSSPAIDRHNGFVEALKEYPDIKLAASLQGDWTEESAVRALQEYKGDLTEIDYVFGQNDRMAIGARKVIAQKQKPLTAKFCGIDALPGKGGGIDCVQRKLLEASCIYPTRGDLVMQLAMAILRGQPYKKENPMKSAIVNKDNATVMLMQVEEMNTQNSLLKELHGRVDSYLSQYHHQQVYTLLAAIIAIIVIAASLYIIITMRRRHEMEREAYEMVTSSRPSPQESMTAAGSQQPSPNTSDPAPYTQQQSPDSGYLHQTYMGEMENDQLPEGVRLPFLEQLRLQIHENLNDSNYSVEQLAADMGLSRAQLYRKVKVLTGRTPVDIIRLNRLNRAKYLLASTDMSISEIAYAVGFTAPSYFTKCFKDEFGISPKASIQRSANA